jgi:hypothetical protein
VETVSVHTNRLVASLDDIRRTPLDRIPTSKVTDVVRRVVKRESDPPMVEVATFGSCI